MPEQQLRKFYAVLSDDPLRGHSDLYTYAVDAEAAMQIFHALKIHPIRVETTDLPFAPTHQQEQP